MLYRMEEEEVDSEDTGVKDFEGLELPPFSECPVPVGDRNMASVRMYHEKWVRLRNRKYLCNRKYEISSGRIVTFALTVVEQGTAGLVSKQRNGSCPDPPPNATMIWFVPVPDRNIPPVTVQE